MSKPYRMRRAQPAELGVVSGILDERIAWLRARDCDQWNTGHSFRTQLANSISQGNTWLLVDGGLAIATVTVSWVGDPDFWTPQELADVALYMTKMATVVERQGEEIGALMLCWAQDRAANLGATAVRWDVWRTNYALQNYYRNRGAKFLRIVDAADRRSGALFELSPIPQVGINDEIITETESAGIR